MRRCSITSGQPCFPPGRPPRLRGRGHVVGLLSLPLWLSIGRRLFSENVVRTAAVLYLTNVKVLLCIGTGQNQIWIAFLLAAALWLQLRDRPFWSGLMLGVGLRRSRCWP